MGWRARGTAFPGLPARRGRNVPAATGSEEWGPAWRDGCLMLQEPAGGATQESLHHSLPHLGMSHGEGTCTATLQGGAMQGICSTRSSPGHSHDAA